MQKHDCSCLNMKMCFLSLRFFKCRFGIIRTDNLQFDRVFFSTPKSRQNRENEHLKIIIFEFQSFEKSKFCGLVSFIGKRPFIYHFSENFQFKISTQNSSKNFIVAAYSKIDKNDLLTWTDYQQNKKVEFLTGIFTFHLLPKILSRINSNNLRWRLKVRAQRKSPCFNSRCIMDWNVSSLSHV